MSDDPRRGESRAESAHDPASRADSGLDSPGLDHRRDQSSDDVDWQTYVYDLVSSAAAVALVGVFLFAVSGVWPPLVAIESPSMTPHIQQGDLVFVMDENRFPGDGSVAGTGVVPADRGAEHGYRTFQRPGDVIVYQPNGNAEDTPIIHRAMFWVEEGERWYDRADPDYVGSADSCEEMTHCPAEESGFITKGDYNQQYDQVGTRPLSAPVRPEWVIGTAEVRVPELGEIRLRSGGIGAAPVNATGGNDTRTGPSASTNGTATPAAP